MINVEFRVIPTISLANDWKFLRRASLPTVPLCGQLINIDGEPFIVHTMNWAVAAGDDQLFCNINVLRY